MSNNTITPVTLDPNLLGIDPSPALVLDIDLDALEREALASGWRPGDDLHQAAYKLVQKGLTWRQACADVGVDYCSAQHRYRLRGLPSPIRKNPIPTIGTRSETAAVVYTLVLHGAKSSVVAPAHGISRQFLFAWAKKAGLPSPTASLRAATAGIAALKASCVK